MSAWSTLQTGAVTFGFSLLMAFITYLLSPRVRLIWGIPHTFNHRLKLDGEEAGVSTAMISISNVGRARATNVEIVFNWNVETISVWPQRAYEVTKNPEGRMCLGIKDLGPKEFFQIHLIDVGRQLPSVLTVRSSEGTGHQVDLAPMRVYPRWFNLGVVTFMFIGAFSLLFAIVVALKPFVF